MRIGILTFHASHNYGSMLQAFALQHYLKGMGHDVETINLRNDAQNDFYHYPLRPVKGKYKNFIKDILSPKWMYHECRKWRKYEVFLENNLSLTKKVYKYWEEIEKDLSNLKYDCLITGGDQIWNVKCIDFDKSYFLPSKLLNIKKISYSPSFGNSLPRLSNEDKIFIKTHLADYNHISVREQSMKDYLSSEIENRIDVTVDPTLLLSAKDYDGLISEKPIIKGKYAYYYSPQGDLNLERLAFLIGEKYGLNVYTSFPHRYRNTGLKPVYDAGPSEFLNLVKNADLVIGRSYHLVVFSILFHKEFIALSGDKDKRMSNILSSLNLLERGSVNDNNLDCIPFKSIDYQIIDNIIDSNRQESQSYLKSILGCPQQTRIS